MNSRSCFITGVFESDGEWNQENLEKLDEYGVFCLPKLDSENILDILLSVIPTGRINQKTLIKRQETFKNGLGSLIITLKEIIPI